MPRGPPRAHEIRGHHGLAVSRLEGVKGAERRRQQRREHEDARADLRRRDERGERVARRRATVRLEPERALTRRRGLRGCGGRAVRRRRRRDRDARERLSLSIRRRRRGRAGGIADRRQRRNREGHGGLEILGRAIEQVGGVVGQRAAAVAVRHRGLDHGDTRPRPGNHLFPSGSLGVVAVPVDQVVLWLNGSRIERGAVDDAELHGRQIAGARREEDLACAALEGEPAAIQLEPQSRPERLGLARQVWAHARMPGLGDDAAVLDLLEGRDLGEVEHILHLDGAGEHADRRVVTDGEIPHRVRVSRRGRAEDADGHEAAAQEEASQAVALHRVSVSARRPAASSSRARAATAACSTWKCGFVASARARYSRARTGLPAARWIIPA